MDSTYKLVVGELVVPLEIACQLESVCDEKIKNITIIVRLLPLKI
jgi:hypothetical protein